jgi:hypothetical protein
MTSHLDQIAAALLRDGDVDCEPDARLAAIYIMLAASRLDPDEAAAEPDEDRSEAQSHSGRPVTTPQV